MKHVFLYAYDKVNLGDDLFIRTISGRYPGTNFYLWSDAMNRHNFADINNLTVLNQQSRLLRATSKIWPSFPSRYRAWMEARCDAAVYIGGSIFIEYPHWERYVSWWKEKARQNQMYVLGANWGPYSTPEYKEGMAEAFGAMQDICFRDLYSQTQFSHVKNVRYAPDILLLAPIPNCEIKKKQVFVSLIDCGGEAHAELRKYKEDYLDNMSALVKRYLEEGWRVVLSSFCKHEGDELAVSEVLTNIIDSRYADRISILSYDGTNSNEILMTISESDYVISTRFHGVILALAAGRPVLPVIYSDKTKHTLNSIGFEGRCFDLRSQKTISFTQSQENWHNHRKYHLDHIRSDAEKHFSKLDMILK